MIPTLNLTWFLLMIAPLSVSTVGGPTDALLRRASPRAQQAGQGRVELRHAVQPAAGSGSGGGQRRGSSTCGKRKPIDSASDDTSCNSQAATGSAAIVGPTAAQERIAAMRRRIQLRPAAAPAPLPGGLDSPRADGSLPSASTGIRGRDPTPGRPLGIDTAAAVRIFDSSSDAQRPRSPPADPGIRGRTATPGPASSYSDRRQLIAQLRNSHSMDARRAAARVTSSGDPAPPPRSTPCHRDGEGLAAQPGTDSAAGPARRQPAHSARAALFRQVALSRS